MARVVARKRKDPDSTVPFEFNWASYLKGDSITASTWIVPTGLTKASESNTTTTSKVILTGGVNGKTYEITNRITTAGGITDDRSFSLEVTHL